MADEDSEYGRVPYLEEVLLSAGSHFGSLATSAKRHGLHSVPPGHQKGTAQRDGEFRPLMTWQHPAALASQQYVAEYPEGYSSSPELIHYLLDRLRSLESYEQSFSFDCSD